MSENPQIQNKADRDRIRQRASGNRAVVDRIRSIVETYRQGRAASSCMAEIEQAVGKGK